MKKLKIILIIILAILVGSIVLIFSLTRINNIEIKLESTQDKNLESNDSNQNLIITKDEILSKVNIKKGDRLFGKSDRDIKSTLLEIPYISSVSIKRHLNGTLDLIISQRQIVYQINYAGEYIYIDGFGYILEQTTEMATIPILIGTTTDFSKLEIGKAGNRLNEDDLEKLDVVNDIMEVSKSNGIYDLITSVDISDSTNYSIRMDGENKTAYLGYADDLNTRILYIKAIIEKESGISGEIFVNRDLDKGYVFFRESV